jgi:hypothetical protein
MPLDLDLLHVNLFLLSLERLLTVKASILCSPIDFILISSNNKDVTTSSNFNVDC